MRTRGTKTISISKLRLLSLFSGIGAFERALEQADIDFELIGFCEIDKYASQSYCAIHDAPDWLNFTDVTNIGIETLEDFDLLTWGFPCQDISVAGHQAGLEGKRSGLYKEGMRILEAKRPKYSIVENVKALTFKSNKEGFEQILTDLERLGYTNYWKVLNAKDYGIPQNRERVFIISVLGDHEPMIWPEPFDNGLRLRDVLDDEVDEKYYISDEKAQALFSSTYVGRRNSIHTGRGVVSTLCARDYKEPKCVCVGNMNPSGRGMEGNVFSVETLSPTITTNKGEDPRVAVPCLTPDRLNKRQNGRRFKDDGEPMFTLTGQDRHGVLQIGSFSREDIKDNERQRRVYSEEGCSPSVLARTDSPKVLQVGNIVDAPNRADPQRGRVYSSDGVSPILNTMQGGGLEPKVITDDTYGVVADNYRIRKLTPTECWRLMGFTDNDVKKCMDIGISNTQLYKQAGNSIVVDVLEAIFRQLFKGG